MPGLKCMIVNETTQVSEWGKALLEIVGAKHDLGYHNPAQSLEQFADIDVLINEGDKSITADIVEAAPNLKLWQVISVGVDKIDFSAARKRGIPVSHVPGSTSAAGLSDTAMMFILMLAKGYQEGIDHIRRDDLWIMGTHDVEGKKLGVIGFGASGRALARKAKAFDMQIMIIEPMAISPEALAAIDPNFVGRPDQVDDVMAEADFISLHLPLSDKTRGVIDARRIGLMKPTTCFINVARGGLVDERALYQALLDGNICGIGTDVFANDDTAAAARMLDHPRFVASPHVSGTTPNAYRRRAEAALENINRIAEGMEPKYLVRR